MPDNHDDHDHPSREREYVLREGSKFQLDVKAALMIGGTLVAIAGTWFEQKARVSSLEYEIRAEITRVENAGDRRIAAVEQRLVQIQATNCAIARSLKVLTAECGRSEP